MVSSNIYIPENLDIDSLLELYPDTRVKRYKLLYIISQISEIQAYGHEKHDKGNGWVPIHSSVIKKNGVHDFKEHKHWLRQAGVIECDDWYSVGEKTYWFRFAEKYQSPIKNDSITKWTLVKKINNRRIERNAVGKRMYPELYNAFNQIEINAKCAKDYVQCQYLHDLDEANSLVGSRKTKARKKAVRRRNIGMINIDKITNKDFHFAVDDVAGRLHTNLTNIKKELRNFVTIDGRMLGAVDYKNSQPLMSIALFNPEFWVDRNSNKVFGYEFELMKRNKLNIWEEEESEEKFSKSHNSTDSFGKKLNVNDLFKELREVLRLNEEDKGFPIMFPISSLGTVNTELNGFPTLWNECVQSFVDCVIEGRFYEYMDDSIQKKNDLILEEMRNTDRDELKKMVLKVFFSSNKFYKQKQATPKRIFNMIFPEVYKMFAFIKQFDKSTLAILLQNIESTVMLNRVARRITHERPDLPVLTIHDSIATYVEEREYVEMVMKDEIRKAIGVSCSVESEIWAPESISNYIKGIAS